MMTLDPTKTYKLPIKNGYLDIRVASDPDYPGLDVEYIDDNEKSMPPHTRPRVLIECPKHTNKLRTLVWGNPKSEDYSEEVEFEDEIEPDYEVNEDDKNFLSKHHIFIVDVFETDSNFEQSGGTYYYIITAKDFDEAQQIFKSECDDMYTYCTYMVYGEIDTEKLIDYAKENPDDFEYIMSEIRSLDNEKPEIHETEDDVFRTLEDFIK